VAQSTKYSWTPEEVEKLARLIASGASAARAAAALGRKIMAVQVKARSIGKPFQTVREMRKKLYPDSPKGKKPRPY
jgi:hypothetical protein